ncbi:MAG: hypothetical protein Q4C82_01670 [Eubacteriales bacterium]|nr:hypothetical protein [Eubacteriales bacterium]
MKKKIVILVLSAAIGLGAAACLGRSCAQPGPEPLLSWWTLMYERPNPDRLPVKVSFWWAKGT